MPSGGGRPVAAVALVLLAGLGLRLWGIGYGLPFVVHPDENRQVLDALGMAQRMSPVPAEFSYPALHKYLLVAADGAYYALGLAAGWFKDPADFALKFLEGESRVILVGRLLSVAAGIGVCLAAWKMATRLFSRSAGIFALVFSAGMFHLIQHSQWAISDIFLALFTTLALFYIMLSSEEGAGSKNLALACLYTGLAISTKPQGLFLIPPLIISQYFALKDSGGPLKMAVCSKKYLIGAAVLALSSATGNLAWFAEFDAALDKFMMLKQVALVGISSREPFAPGLLTLTAWFAKELARQEGPLGALLVIGVVYALFKRTRRDLIFLSYLALFMFAVKDWAIRYLHLFVAVFPAMCVFGARALAEAFEASPVRRNLASAFAVALILHSLAGTIEASIKKTGPDTRLLAKDWLEKNIPAGTTIAMDWYEFAVPLYTSTPVYLANPKAAGYYESRLPDSIRERYSAFLSDRPVYKVVPVIYSTRSPNWPLEMAPGALKAASSKEVYRELYTVFNFRPVAELKRSGASYLVITSYGYTNFLLDTDPAKNAASVFNYLYKEDLLSFNTQADAYIDDGRFGLLYYLNKRARDFYEPLLQGRQARLVKEFQSGDGLTGPVIKIYGLD